jgi:hypothetical protein
MVMAGLDRTTAGLADLLRRSAILRTAKRRVGRHVFGRDPVRIVEELSPFAPYSAGAFPTRAALTLLSVQQTFPLVLELLARTGHQRLEPIDIQAFCGTTVADPATGRLKELLDQYGSDKATDHDYHLLYGHVLAEPETVRAMLEIGMGTNNRRVVSSMGPSGRPGASLRAFRDFLPHATVYGADVDEQILFSEDRIETCRVDQTDLGSFGPLAMMVGVGLDLVIDDGLHAPNANLAVLLFALERLRVGGWLVIEDISPDATPIWQVVAALLPTTYRPALLRARGGMLFVAQRTG